MIGPGLGVLLSTRTVEPVVHLIGGPYVEVAGARVEIPTGSKRLVAYLAVSGGWAERRALAGRLWPHGTERRAAGNLRSAAWRLRGAGIDLIDSDKWSLRLRAGTVVDFEVISGWAARLIEGTALEADWNVRGCWTSSALELLPGWYDEWVIVERERLRQRVLHGLEALSRRLVSTRRPGDAVEAATAVVNIDPLRESAQRVLVEAHLAADNLPAAGRVFRCYRRLVLHELNIAPGTDFARLLADAERASTRRRSPIGARTGMDHGMQSSTVV